MNNKANVKTLKVRVKDKHRSLLERMAFGVNQLWNLANEITSQLSYVPLPEQGYIHQDWSAYDLQNAENNSKRTSYVGVYPVVHFVHSVGYRLRKEQLNGKTDKFILQGISLSYGIATASVSMNLDQGLSRKIREGVGILIL